MHAVFSSFAIKPDSPRAIDVNISYLVAATKRATGFSIKCSSVGVQLGLCFQWALQVSLQLMEQEQDVKHSINIEMPQHQPQWMTVRHWRGPSFWADTIHLNIKTWCQMVIKSQLWLTSMKTQLSVSERGARRVPARAMTGESENKGGKTRGTKGERWRERMRESSRGRGDGTRQHWDECSTA